MEDSMKRLVLAIAGGFLAGFFCYHAIFEDRVLAQSSDVPRELVNQKFVLVDESRKAVGGLSFDRSGDPVISLTGELGKDLRGRIVRVACEIRPWLTTTPPEHRNPE
jgi:hypothetical protein